MNRNDVFLMANLGSEFLRVIAAREKRDATLVSSAAARAVLICERALTLAKTDGARQEIALLKGILDEYAAADAACAVTKAEIEAYFNPFALRLLAGRA